MLRTMVVSYNAFVLCNMFAQMEHAFVHHAVKEMKRLRQAHLR